MNSDDFETLRQMQKEADEVHKKMLAEGTATPPVPDDTAAWVQAGESGYVNCLITVLGEGPSTSVVLDLKAALPDLNTLADGNPSLLTWTKQLNFNYQKLSREEVFAIVINSFDLHSQTSGRMKTVLVNSDNAPVALIFTAEKSSQNDQITLSVLRANH